MMLCVYLSLFVSFFYFVFCCFFFKQKTAYEMRISDWSSDVCSSDLRKRTPTIARAAAKARTPGSSTGIARQQVVARKLRLAAKIDGIAEPPPARPKLLVPPFDQPHPPHSRDIARPHLGQRQHRAYLPEPRAPHTPAGAFPPKQLTQPPHN